MRRMHKYKSPLLGYNLGSCMESMRNTYVRQRIREKNSEVKEVEERGIILWREKRKKQKREKSLSYISTHTYIYILYEHMYMYIYKCVRDPRCRGLPCSDANTFTEGGRTWTVRDCTCS